MPAIAIEKIDACWWEGIGIKETILAVHRCCGIRPTFDQVQRRFAALSWEMAA